MRHPAQLEAFCRREFPRLVGTLTLYCGDLHLAEELAQEALVRACEHWEEVAVMAAPGPWVHRVAINAANSYWRRIRTGRAARRRLQDTVSTVHTDPDVASNVALREAVRSLPARQRAALVLRYYADLSVADTAAALGVSDQAVRNLTHRGVAALRRQLANRPELVPAEVERDR